MIDTSSVFVCMSTSSKVQYMLKAWLVFFSGYFGIPSRSSENGRQWIFGKIFLDAWIVSSIVYTKWLLGNMEFLFAQIPSSKWLENFLVLPPLAKQFNFHSRRVYRLPVSSFIALFYSALFVFRIWTHFPLVYFTFGHYVDKFQKLFFLPLIWLKFWHIYWKFQA